MIHRYCPPEGSVLDMCADTMRTAIAAMLLGRFVLVNDRDPDVVNAGARDALQFMAWAHNEGCLPDLGQEPPFSDKILLGGYYAWEVKNGGKMPPSNDVRVVAKNSTPSGLARNMDQLNVWARDNGWLFKGSEFIPEPHNMAAFLTKEVEKGETLCGVFGAARNRKPRITDGKIVGLKLSDDENGAARYMAINKFCPALYVNDPNFPGAAGKVTEQVVNCYIEEDYGQPDGSPYAVRLCGQFERHP